MTARILLEQRLRQIGVERRAAPALEQAPGEVEGLRLDPQALARHFEPAAGAARVGISPRGLGGDGDPAEVEGGLDRLDVGAARLDRAADTAEQVELVADVETGIEDEVRPLPFPRIGISDAAAHGRRRQPPRAGLPQHRAGLAKIGGGHPQVGVAGQRLLDQAVEQRIGEQAPPASRRLVAGEGGRGGAGEAALVRRAENGRPVIGSDGEAGGERQRRQGRDERAPHSAGSGGGSS